MKCPKCDSTNIRIQVPVGVSAPAELEGKFSKAMFRRADVNLTHANWECLDRVCVDCCWSCNGYGNYVSRLATENESLKLESDKQKSELTQVQSHLSVAEDIIQRLYNLAVSKPYLTPKQRKDCEWELISKMEELGCDRASGIDWKRLVP